MLNFDLYMPARIVFGKDTQHKIGKLIAPKASKVLIHYGGGSVVRSGLLDQVLDSLKAAGIDYVQLGGVKPNPRLGLVHEGIALCRKEGVDHILAVGGGSAIDSAKAIAMGYYLDGRVQALWGTHTHVPTADGQVLAKGTGFVTDLGMTGPAHSVLGIRPEQAIIKLGVLVSPAARSTALPIIGVMSSTEPANHQLI